MRLATLDLLAFGHFTNKTLVFADKSGAIDVVYGNNEAGKSTSRRGVSGFFFGIPVRTTDDFVHQKPTLRIGANVITSTGEKLQLVRRKGSKDTLRDGGDNVVDEEILARALSGLDRDLFEQMFSLSRDELVNGGNDLLAGKGSLGEALFGASMGLAGINDLVHALESEAADLFKPGGSVPALNKTLRDLEESRRKVRDSELRPAEYLAHESALSSALTERANLDGELRRMQTELARLERNKQLLPLAVLRSQITAAFEELGDVIVLSESARQERLDAQRDQGRAEAQIADLQGRIDSFKFQLTVVRPNEALIARGDEIRSLHTEIGAHRKAARDLPGLRTQHRSSRARAETFLAQTHPDRQLGDIADLRLTVADRTAIASLSDQFGRLDEAKQQATLRVEQAKGKLKRAEKSLAELPETQETAGAVAVLEAARRLGDIEAAITGEEATWRAADTQLHADLAALPLFDGSIDDLERLPVPVGATVTRFLEAYDDIDMGHRDLSAQQARLADELAGHQQSLDAFESAVAVPSEDDLASARAHREHGWELVRQTLENGDSAIDTATFTSEKPLADAYEESVVSADDVSDRLRRESSQVARYAELEASFARCHEQLETVRSDLATLITERERLDAEWNAVWGPTSMSPLPPAEMQAWLTSRRELVSETGGQRAARAELDAKSDLITQHSAALRREIEDLGGSANEKATLAELVVLLTVILDDQRSRSDALARARVLVVDATDELAEATLLGKQADTEFKSWSSSWTTAITTLGLGGDLTPEQARSIVDTLTELFKALDEAASFESRIESIERDAGTFADAATALAANVAPDIGDLEPEDLVLALERFLNVALADATQVEGIEQQLEDLTAQQRKAQKQRESAENELQRLMNAAGCSSLEELEGAEDRSAKAIALRSELRNHEEQMTLIAAAPAAEVAAEVVGLQLEQLEVQIADLSEQLQQLGEDRRRLDETVGQERTLLTELGRGEGAAVAAAAVESAKATAREQAEQYALLKLALAVLRREIERFREESHGPLLTRASHFFAKLTCQEHAGLTTAFDDRSNVILVGRRANGPEITVDQMSEGTRDQLYLALRLATIEQQLDRSEPLPLIVDDLFVNFDDDRAAAGFEILAELAAKTQVIFFTHHHHLVELAKSTLSAEHWALQELSASDAGRLIQAA
ncbi:MAG: AAA family ATPase [Gaiellaceae bacterium]